jgi:signal transduction histidine kinase
VLVGFLETLDRCGPDIADTVRADMVGRCRTQADRLNELLLRLLSLSRVSTGWRAQIRPVDADTIVQRVLEATHVSPRVVRAEESVLLADPDALELVLHHLLDNASKYGDPSSIELTAVRASDEVHLIVSDAGPGIGPEDRERMFERFVRGRETLAVPGLGVGLAFARECVEAMGGTVRYEPGVPRGARFIVALPAAPVMLVPTG